MRKINREYYKNLLEVNSNERSCSDKVTKENPIFISDSLDISYSLLKYSRLNFNLCKSAEWILGFDMYVKSIQNSFQGDLKESVIERGHIIEFDVFGNVGTEQDKNRPAIVLLVNGRNGAIIAPIGKAAFNSGKHYHVSLQKNNKDQGNMKFNCGIKLEQIRYIDKNRITGKYGKVSNVKKLNEIDEKLVRNMTNHFYRNFKTLERNNHKLNSENISLSKEISDRDDEIKRLKNKIQILEQELDAMSLVD